MPVPSPDKWESFIRKRRKGRGGSQGSDNGYIKKVLKMELPGRRKTTEMVFVVMKKGMQSVSVTEEHSRDRIRWRQMICCRKGPVKRRRRICIYHFRYRNLTHPLPDKSGFKGR